MKFKPRDMPAKTLTVDRRERGKSAVGCGISEVSIIAPRDEPSASQTPAKLELPNPATANGSGGMRELMFVEAAALR